MNHGQIDNALKARPLRKRKAVVRGPISPLPFPGSCAMGDASQVQGEPHTRIVR